MVRTDASQESGSRTQAATQSQSKGCALSTLGMGTPFKVDSHVYFQHQYSLARARPACRGHIIFTSLVPSRAHSYQRDIAFVS